MRQCVSFLNVSSQTFEPPVCRADHGVALFPVKLDHPARGNRKRCRAFFRRQEMDPIARVDQGATNPSMCWRKPSRPQLCNNWDTMSWKEATHALNTATNEERGCVEPSCHCKMTLIMQICRSRLKGPTAEDLHAESIKCVVFHSPAWRCSCASWRPGCAAPPGPPAVWDRSGTRSSAWKKQKHAEASLYNVAGKIGIYLNWS